MNAVNPQPCLPPALSLREASWYADTLRCNRCGFCTASCPTYVITGEEGQSPRGRVQAFRAFLEERIEEASAARKAFDTCLMCGQCTTVCFGEAPTARLMAAARTVMSEEQGIAVFWRYLRWFLFRPRWLGWFLQGVWVLDRVGLLSLAVRCGLGRLLGLSGEGMLAMASALHPWGSLGKETLGARASCPQVSRLVDSLGKENKTFSPHVVRFECCGTARADRRIGRATASLLSRARGGMVSAGNVCCGLAALSAGDWDTARELARRNISRLEKWPDAMIVADDSSCAASLKDYPALFADDPSWQARAEVLASRTRDLLQWGAVHMNEVMERIDSPPPVVWHDACKARLAQGLIHEPRLILEGLGVSVQTPLEPEMCCGGGPSTVLKYPAMAQALAEMKTAHLEATSAPVMLTSSLSCLTHLRGELRRRHSPIRAEHWARFLDSLRSLC